MLPNHAPYVIAEQFGTLATLFPGRIDLGLGRAPGTDQQTLRGASPRCRRTPSTSRRTSSSSRPSWRRSRPGQRIEAVPGAGTEVPIWILGSSLFGAQLAAELGLPFGFASHFAPQQLDAALAIYRERFKPSPQLAAPHAMVGVNVIAAEHRRRGAAGWPRRSRCRSPTSCAARAASSSRRSTTSTPTGLPHEKFRAVADAGVQRRRERRDRARAASTRWSSGRGPTS